MAYNRLVRKLTKENLWIYVLALLQERSMYAYEIKKALKERFMVNPATVTVYVALYKMEGEGLIAPGGTKLPIERPDRKYYSITDLGKDTLASGIAFLKETLNKVSK